MRTPISTLAVLLVLSLAGCGGDDEPTSEPERTESPSSAAPSETPSPTEDAELLACELADETDVEAAFGKPFPAGSLGGGSHDEDGLVWQSDNCNWEIDSELEVTLAVSAAEDFEGGALLCPVLEYLDTRSTPVPELGEAFWVGYEGNEVEGTVRVCTDDVLLDVDVDAPAGSIDLATLRTQTVAFAGAAVASLPA